LVAARGRLMALAGRQQSGATAFVLGFGPEAVERVCAQVRQRFGYVKVASIDSAQSAVLSGNASSVERAIGLARRLGATAGPLPATVAAHSMMMATVSARLARIAARMTWRDPQVPLVGSARGRPLTSGAAIRAELVNQVAQTVRWHESMDTLLAAGCEYFLELGPGHVLTGLARRRDDELVAMAADSPAKLIAFGERLAMSRVAAELDLAEVAENQLAS
jgi:[acyl-carrier-protein] S-malonyltransferase